ncbi:hypothetical protein niasHS_016250 [Heterodera schachtii]|uniref:Secreted protein n=1 Tax=Heterodera schachtii TaxID=97005 RepID=A0ABD2HSK6_HETSC
MQLASNAILLLLSLLAVFSHCAAQNHGEESNPSVNGRKTKNNPQNSPGFVSSLAKAVTGVLALTAAGLPGADCAPRPLGYGKPAETAVNSVTAVDLSLAQPASVPTQSFSTDSKTPPLQPQMRRRMMNKQINAVEHIGAGGGGHGGGSGGLMTAGGTNGGAYAAGAHDSSNNCQSTNSSDCNEKDTGCC